VVAGVATSLALVVGVGLTSLTSLVGLAGCSSAPSDKGAEDVGSTESELKLSGTRYLGKIANGETKTGYYYNPPRYRSFGFDAKGGDEITVDVKSAEGDAVGYITDASYNVLAYNDDASRTTFDAKLTYTIPASKPAGSYRIVFRDYDLLDATFTVKLAITSTVTTTCPYDGQTFKPGDTFPSTDKCNTCTCGENGAVGCTKRACVCDPANEPWRVYVGTPQQCATIRYTCTAGQRPFQNTCGCGCEQL
jgi:hypothetical protein